MRTAEGNTTVELDEVSAKVLADMPGKHTTINEEAAKAKAKSAKSKPACTCPGGARPDSSTVHVASCPRHKAKPKPKPAKKPAAKTEPKPKAAKPQRNLQAEADAIAEATRLKDARALITAKSGREARITIPGETDVPVTLAFISVVNATGLRVHVQGWGSEERKRVESVAEAAALVKTSPRRTPKPPRVKAEKPAAK